MREIRNQFFIIFAFMLLGYLVYSLATILTPFLLGTLLAYIASPIVKYLDKKKVPHLLSVCIVFFGMFFVLIGTTIVFIPILQKQMNNFLEVLPLIITWLQETVWPTINQFMPISSDSIKSTLTTALPKSGWVVSTVIHSSQKVVEWVVNFVLTFVVMFYLLRDWEKLLKQVLNIFPLSWHAKIKLLAKECDEVLSAFFKGQLLVMLALGFIYGLGLTLIGLRVGLMIGLIGGILSIVPYLGSLFILVVGMVVGFIQFGNWQILEWILLVYVIGQVIEGYVLTPYLVGERIGLHPVMVIFSVLAFGSLFGFFGVLVALPAAAVINVLLRHVQKEYVKHL